MLKMQNTIASRERRRRREQHGGLLQVHATDRMPARLHRSPWASAGSHVQKGHVMIPGPD